MIDYHIHTNHSIDAEGDLKDYCEVAARLGLKEICFTNHCELDPHRDDNLIKFNNQKLPLTRENVLHLAEEVMAIKDEYQGRGLVIRFGFEVGYYDGVERRLADTITGIEFDYILAGIHCLDHVCIDSSREYEKYFSKKTASEMLDKYFSVAENLVRSEKFNAFAHLDVYKRYGLEFYGNQLRDIPEQRLRSIFRVMAQNGTALEINTAGLRRHNEFYPSVDIMKLAKEQGIKMLVLGSDCHRVEDLGKGIKEGLEYAKAFGFDAVYGFSKQKPIKIKI